MPESVRNCRKIEIFNFVIFLLFRVMIENDVLRNCLRKSERVCQIYEDLGARQSDKCIIMGRLSIIQPNNRVEVPFILGNEINTVRCHQNLFLDFNLALKVRFLRKKN